MPKIEFNTNFFKIDGRRHSRDVYEMMDNPVSEQVGIVNRYHPSQKIVHPVIFSEWTDSGDSPYASYGDLVSDFESFFF